MRVRGGAPRRRAAGPEPRNAAACPQAPAASASASSTGCGRILLGFVFVWLVVGGCAGASSDVILPAREVDDVHLPCSQFKNTYFAETCSGSEAGSYLRLIDFCITQL